MQASNSDAAGKPLISIASRSAGATFRNPLEEFVLIEPHLHEHPGCTASNPALIKAIKREGRHL
jgi:hypothetical protein